MTVKKNIHLCFSGKDIYEKIIVSQFTGGVSMSRAKFEDNEIGAVCGNSEEKEKIQRLRDELNNADAVVIGAGLGLSASAGLVYSGKRFEKYFEDFCDKYGFCDMIDGRNKGDAASRPKTDYFVVTT